MSSLLVLSKLRQERTFGASVKPLKNQEATAKSLQLQCFGATEDCGVLRWKYVGQALKIRRERYRMGSNPATDTK